MPFDSSWIYMVISFYIEFIEGCIHLPSPKIVHVGIEEY